MFAPFIHATCNHHIETLPTIYIGTHIQKYEGRNAYFITLRAQGTQPVRRHLKGGAQTVKNAEHAAYLISALYSLWLHLTALIFLKIKFQGKILPYPSPEL